MKTYLLKLNKHRAHEHRIPADGRINLRKSPDVCHEYVLADARSTMTTGTAVAPVSAGSGALDWQYMFEHLTGGGGSGGGGKAADTATAAMALAAGGGNNATHRPHQHGTLLEYNALARGDTQERHSECRIELDTLRNRIGQQYRILAATRSFDSVIEQRDLPLGWRLKGTLVTHLHEHRAAVTRLTALSADWDGAAGGLFASCSLDGTVRIWDINRLDGNQSINRSTQVYNANVPLSSMASADGGRSLAVAGRDGSLMLLRIDTNSTKMALQEAKNLNEMAPSASELPYGPIVDMQPLQHGSQSLIVYATMYGTIVCWDLRMPDAAWRLNTLLRNGVVTSMCADPTGSWMTTATSSGRHVCWDLRFQLPIGERKSDREIVRDYVSSTLSQPRFVIRTIIAFEKWSPIRPSIPN